MSDGGIMTKNELINMYFEWMYDIVCPDKKKSYRKLLYFLHSVDFTYLIDMDGNRFEDGIELRYRFGHECAHIDMCTISEYLDERPCSMLEMMIALAIRLEEHIMSNPDIGNRTAQWFWNMLSSLGLADMDDAKFNKEQAKTVIQRFLNREYEPNGCGGLFTINNCAYDLRTVDIWYQACWYLDQFV